MEVPTYKLQQLKYCVSIIKEIKFWKLLNILAISSPQYFMKAYKSDNIELNAENGFCLNGLHYSIKGHYIIVLSSSYQKKAIK